MSDVRAAFRIYEIMNTRKRPVSSLQLQLQLARCYVNSRLYGDVAIPLENIQDVTAFRGENGLLLLPRVAVAHRSIKTQKHDKTMKINSRKNKT